MFQMEPSGPQPDFPAWKKTYPVGTDIFVSHEYTLEVQMLGGLPKVNWAATP